MYAVIHEVCENDSICGRARACVGYYYTLVVLYTYIYVHTRLACLTRRFMHNARNGACALRCARIGETGGRAPLRDGGDFYSGKLFID